MVNHPSAYCKAACGMYCKKIIKKNKSAKKCANVCLWCISPQSNFNYSQRGGAVRWHSASRATQENHRIVKTIKQCFTEAIYTFRAHQEKPRIGIHTFIYM